MYDLTERDAFLSFFSLSLSLFPSISSSSPLFLSLSLLHKTDESGKIAVYELAHSSSPRIRTSDIRFAAFPSRGIFYLSTVSFKFYVSRQCYTFFMDLRSIPCLMEEPSRRAALRPKNANTH